MNWWRNAIASVKAILSGAPDKHLPVQKHAPIAAKETVPPQASPLHAPLPPDPPALLPESPTGGHFLPWLVSAQPAPLQPGDISAAEQSVLAELQALLLLKNLPDALLPRMADLLPQLIALTRENNLPVRAIALRVSKDPLLTAEVLRLTSSSYYNLQQPITDIVQAIQLIGSAGLQMAIARIVLKPIYHETGGLVSASVVARLAAHAEALGDRCAHLAEPAGQLRFDAYLAGMLHDTGWRVALYAIERAKLKLAPVVSEKFAIEMTEVTHRLFGLAARRWPITPGFTALAQDAFSHGLADGQHPLVTVLRSALQHCQPDLSSASQAQQSPL